MRQKVEVVQWSDFFSQSTAVINIDARKLDRFVANLKKYDKTYLSLVYFLAVTMEPSASQAAASNGMQGGMTLIVLMQKAAFWLGMAVSIWGIVEAQLDFPGWRGRILKGVLGYIGILLIPLIFLELQNNIGASTWQQMQDQNTPLVPQTTPTPAPSTVPSAGGVYR